MAREREITCGDHSFTTKANPRVFVRCPQCGTGHRAPAIADGWKGPGPAGAPASAIDASHDTVSAAAELVESVLPAPASTIVKVTRAAHTTARRAEAAKKTRAPAAKRTKARARPSSSLTPAQRAGRRGGLSSPKPAFLRRVGR